MKLVTLTPNFILKQNGLLDAHQLLALTTFYHHCQFGDFLLQHEEI